MKFGGLIISAWVEKKAFGEVQVELLNGKYGESGVYAQKYGGSGNHLKLR